MTRSRILVTGAAGMVGRNFVEHDAADNYDILQPRRAELDLEDFQAVRDYMAAHRPDIVIHAAGKVGGIQANIREPVAFLVKNLAIGCNVINAARETGVHRFLNLSSSCMYPRNHDGALGEDLILKGELEPTNEGYALAKIVGTRLCEYISREDPSYHYKTIIPCNLYGRHDKFDPAHSHLIPAVIHKIHIAKTAGIESVEIWGDGIARREFMYAGDLADALISAVRNFESLPAVMNVGLGHDHSINEYYSAVAQIVGYKGKFHHDLNRPVGMARKLVNVEKQNAWGWRPNHSLLSGLEKTYQYYLEQTDVQ